MPPASEEVFDSLECFIHAIAPQCEHCGWAVIGHGVQAQRHLSCCAHWARENRFAELTDRVGPAVVKTRKGAGGYAAPSARTARTAHMCDRAVVAPCEEQGR
jgi:hypothetical protein